MVCKEEGGPGVVCDGSERRMGAVTPGETLGTLYNIRVGTNKTKQHTPDTEGTETFLKGVRWDLKTDWSVNFETLCLAGRNWRIAEFWVSFFGGMRGILPHAHLGPNQCISSSG